MVKALKPLSPDLIGGLLAKALNILRIWTLSGEFCLMVQRFLWHAPLIIAAYLSETPAPGGGHKICESLA